MDKPTALGPACVQPSHLHPGQQHQGAQVGQTPQMEPRAAPKEAYFQVPPSAEPGSCFNDHIKVRSAASPGLKPKNTGIVRALELLRTS